MKTRIVLTAIIALAVFGVIFGLWYYKGQRARAARAAMVPPPATVSSTTVEEHEWRSLLTAVGRLESRAGIVLRTEAEGEVVNLAFTSGARAEEGELLVELDSSVEREQLKGLEATAKLAEVQLNRARDLRTARSNSEADLDIAEATFAQANAAVGQMRATIAKKRVVAPFAGRLGITRVVYGQFLNKGDQVVQLEAVDPIYVDFSLPQQHVATIKPGMDVNVVVDAFPGKTFTGAVQAVDPRLDEATFTMLIRAAVPNPDESLRPGMFAQVEVVLPASEKLLVLPAAAIIYSPYGDSVFVIEDGVAQPRFVKPGPQRGDVVGIISGLKAGEQVVTSGQVKLRKGSPVRVDNTAAPDASTAPKPEET